MPDTVTVPQVLSGHAREIWRSAFLSSYDGTCEDRDDRDGCASSIAWAAVKERYRKDADGDWVRKSLAERAEDAVVGQVSPDTGQYPQMLVGQERSAKWRAAFNAALLGECAKAPDPVTCAMEAANRVERDDAFAPDKEMVAMSETRLTSPNLVQRAGLGALDQPAEAQRQKPLAAASTVESLRSAEAEEDQRLITEGMGSRIAKRPAHINSNDWMGRPLRERTISHLVMERAVERSYDEAAERTLAEGGWQGIFNPSRRDEFIFQRWLDTPDGMLLQRAVLVRKTGTTDWRLRELTRGASMSLAVQIPSDERRFGDKRL